MKAEERKEIETNSLIHAVQKARERVTGRTLYYLIGTAALVQEAWHSAAQAEEALVGLPTAAGGTDSRGNVDKVIEYYEKAASIFPDSEPSKRDKARADKIKANKDQFVADQKKIYAERP